MGHYPDPTTFNVVNAFDNSTNSTQDVGLDGLNSEAEQAFCDLLNGLSTALEPDAFAQYQNDRPTTFALRDTKLSQRRRHLGALSILQPLRRELQHQQPDGYPITSTTIPNTEDINEDLTLRTLNRTTSMKSR